MCEEKWRHLVVFDFKVITFWDNKNELMQMELFAAAFSFGYYGKLKYEVET